jgi:hypothetical protein
MITLHLEGTQNGMMLIIMGLILPLLKLSTWISLIYEFTANIGAWFNVIPWLFAAYTGAVVRMGEGQVCGGIGMTPPKDNDYYVSFIGPMLMSCALGDIVSWGIAVYSILYNLFSKSSSIEKKYD